MTPFTMLMKLNTWGPLGVDMKPSEFWQRVELALGDAEEKRASFHVRSCPNDDAANDVIIDFVLYMRKIFSDWEN